MLAQTQRALCLLVIFLLVIIANSKTFIENIAILKHQYNLMQTEEVSQILYILLKPVKICVTTDCCMIQRPKKYHYPYTPDNRISLDANNNKAISQSILIIKITKITFRVTRKQKKKKLQLSK